MNQMAEGERLVKGAGDTKSIVVLAGNGVDPRVHEAETDRRTDFAKCREKVGAVLGQHIRVDYAHHQSMTPDQFYCPFGSRRDMGCNAMPLQRQLKELKDSGIGVKYQDLLCRRFLASHYENALATWVSLPPFLYSCRPTAWFSHKYNRGGFASPYSASSRRLSCMT